LLNKQASTTLATD